MQAFLKLQQAGGYSLVVCGLLIVVASPAAEHRLEGSVWAQWLWLPGSTAQARSCGSQA